MSPAILSGATLSTKNVTLIFDPSDGKLRTLKLPELEVPYIVAWFNPVDPSLV